MSLNACSTDSLTIASTAASATFTAALSIRITVSIPLTTSRASASKSPFSSILNCTPTRAWPFGDGENATSKPPSSQLSFAISRSPWSTRTRIAAWPSAALVNISPALHGMVVLRGISTFISPPKVSIPKLSGVTSSRIICRRAPLKTPPWIVAPRAIASSGCCETSGSREKSSATARRTAGIRVLPPTTTTALRSSGLSAASASAWRQSRKVLPIHGAASFSNSTRVIGSSTLRLPSKNGTRKTA